MVCVFSPQGSVSRLNQPYASLRPEIGRLDLLVRQGTGLTLQPDGGQTALRIRCRGLRKNGRRFSRRPSSAAGPPHPASAHSASARNSTLHLFIASSLLLPNGPPALRGPQPQGSPLWYQRITVFRKMPFIFFTFLLFFCDSFFRKMPQKLPPGTFQAAEEIGLPGELHIVSGANHIRGNCQAPGRKKEKFHASGVALHRIPFSPLAVLPAGVRKDQVVHIVEIPPIPIHHTAPSFLSEDYRIQYSRVGSRLQGQEYTVYIKFLQSFCAGFFSQ